MLASTITKSSITADNTAPREDLPCRGAPIWPNTFNQSTATQAGPLNTTSTVLRIAPKEPHALRARLIQPLAHREDLHSTLRTCRPKCRLQRIPPWHQGSAPAYACIKWKARTKCGDLDEMRIGSRLRGAPIHASHMRLARSSWI